MFVLNSKCKHANKLNSDSEAEKHYMLNTSLNINIVIVNMLAWYSSN